MEPENQQEPPLHLLRLGFLIGLVAGLVLMVVIFRLIPGAKPVFWAGMMRGVGLGLGIIWGIGIIKWIQGFTEARSRKIEAQQLKREAAVAPPANENSGPETEIAS